MPEGRELLEKAGLKDPTGVISLLQNFTLLDQIDQTKLQKPEIVIEPDWKLDELQIKNMSKILIKQNSFIQAVDPTIKGSATTIIPVESIMEFGFASRQGVRTPHGPTQEFAVEWIGTKFDIKDC